MRRSNLTLHKSCVDGHILFSKHVSLIPRIKRRSKSAPFFVSTLSGDLRLFVESICENIPLKGKHNIIMQAARSSRQTDGQTLTHDYLSGRASLSLMANPAFCLNAISRSAVSFKRHVKLDFCAVHTLLLNLPLTCFVSNWQTDIRCLKPKHIHTYNPGSRRAKRL
jgi:hypothetical protein